MAKHLFSKGENNLSATLHEDDVRSIFELKTLLGLDGRWIAEHFGISEGQVSSIVYGRTWRHLNLPIRSYQQIRIDDFWRSVRKESDEECWIWLGKCFRDTGYGKFHWNGKGSTAHKFSYELHFGLVPDGKLVLHSCDNRRCVNPRHLFVGTYQKNVDDMIEKGRQNFSGLVVRDQNGEKNSMVKLTETQVAAIKLARKNGVLGKDLAKAYNVCPSSISKIWRGRRWKHSYED